MFRHFTLKAYLLADFKSVKSKFPSWVFNFKFFIGSFCVHESEWRKSWLQIQFEFFKGNTGTTHAFFNEIISFYVIWIRSAHAKGSDQKFELKGPIRKFSKFGLWGLKIGLWIGFASVKWRKMVYFDLEKVWTFRVSILIGGV